MDTTYRARIIDRLNSRALVLQTIGRWDEADSLLHIALRWEAVWAAQKRRG